MVEMGMNDSFRHMVHRRRLHVTGLYPDHQRKVEYPANFIDSFTPLRVSVENTAMTQTRNICV